jgi:molybdopterin converting factor small subunit
MMKIHVKLYATLTQSLSEAILAKYNHGVSAGSRLEVDLPEGSTLADLVAYLDLPREQVKVIFVNAKARDLEYHLQPADEVGIFPPIGGG